MLICVFRYEHYYLLVVIMCYLLAVTSLGINVLAEDFFLKVRFSC